MQERVNKIIDLLLKEISQLSEPVTFDLEQVSQRLLEQGYTESEIDKAVQWVIMNLTRQQLPPGTKPSRKRSPSLRILTPEELHFFSREAYGYLLQLQSLGIINALLVEQIIERCFLMGLTRIDVEELKAIISRVLLEEHGGSTGSGRVYLPGNDKIN